MTYLTNFTGTGYTWVTAFPPCTERQPCGLHRGRPTLDPLIHSLRWLQHGREVHWWVM